MSFEHRAHARRREQTSIASTSGVSYASIDAALEPLESDRRSRPRSCQLARLQREELRHPVEPPLRSGELALERVQLILCARDVVLERDDLVADDGDLLREDALLRLRVPDLRLERRDALVDVPLLAVDVVAAAGAATISRRGKTEQQAARHRRRNFVRSRTDSCSRPPPAGLTTVGWTCSRPRSRCSRAASSIAVISASFAARSSSRAVSSALTRVTASSSPSSTAAPRSRSPRSRRPSSSSSSCRIRVSFRPASVRTVAERTSHAARSRARSIARTEAFATAVSGLRRARPRKSSSSTSTRTASTIAATQCDEDRERNRNRQRRRRDPEQQRRRRDAEVARHRDGHLDGRRGRLVRRQRLRLGDVVVVRHDADPSACSAAAARRRYAPTSSR